MSIDARSLKRAARSTLLRAGLDVRRVRQPAVETDAPAGYYPISPTCQVEGLGFLFDLYLDRSPGTFVEVGAFDGFTCSNTSGLAERGWRGHYVEPVPASAAACRDRYRDTPRVSIHQLAIGDAPGTLTMHLGGIYSTSDASTRSEYDEVDWAGASFADQATVDVECVTLDHFLDQQHVAPGFDVLVVDVEGAEPEVFAGFDLARFHPRLMIVELADAHPDLAARRSDHARVLRQILRERYVIVYKDAINTVFVADVVYDRAHHLT